MKYWTGVVLTLAALASWPPPSFADSQARIVRLSDVQGAVNIDRNTGQGVEKAFINLPIAQGVKLGAGPDGFAEVQFEDGSTLRITPKTAVAFPELAMRDSGAKLSTVVLAEGIAYVNFAGAKNDQLTLKFAQETVTLTQPARLRLAIDNSGAEVAVFKGDVQVLGPSGSVDVEKNKHVVFDLTANGKYILAKGVPETIYDSWDKAQDQYLQRYSKNSAYTNASYTYGVSDLNYYGNYFNVPGYGLLWQPYLMGAGWDPFMDGMWAWYPGYGYGWVSAYPWGWTPYHCGSWLWVPNYGWAWQPGGSWAGLGNLPVTAGSTHGFVTPRPPMTPVHSMLMVNNGAAASTNLTANRSANMAAMPSTRMTIRSGSAGLGIPRGGISNLNRISQEVGQRGFVTTSVHTSSLGSVSANRSMMMMSNGGMAGYSATTPNGVAARSSGTSMPAASARQSAPASAPSFHSGFSGGTSSSGASSGGNAHSSGGRSK